MAMRMAGCAAERENVVEVWVISSLCWMVHALSGYVCGWGREASFVLGVMPVGASSMSGERRRGPLLCS